MLVESFNTEGLNVPSETAFAMGVEWEMFRRKLRRCKGPFSEQVMELNAQRIALLCHRHGRTVQICWIHDDYHEWRIVRVGGI